MDHQRRADDAVVDRLLQRAVALVVAALEADLNEMAAGGDLRLDDAHAGLGGRGERLLAEHRLAGLDRGEDISLMRRPPGGDDDRVHVGAAISASPVG